MDLFEASARILSQCTDGATYERLVAANRQLQYHELDWLLKMLINRRLLEHHSSAFFTTATDGIKLLEIRFNMERMLQLTNPLV